MKNKLIWLAIISIILGLTAGGLNHYKPWLSKETPIAEQKTIEKKDVVKKPIVKKEVTKPKAKTEEKVANSMKEYCVQVKEYVSKYGEEEVRKAAKERGYTNKQIKQLEKCIK